MNKLISAIRLNVLLEFRNWTHSVGLILFVWIVAYVIYRINTSLTASEFNFIFWLFLLLVSLSIVMRSESQTSRSQKRWLYTLISPIELLITKIVFNTIYLALISFAFYGFMLLLFYPQVEGSMQFSLLIATAAVSISSCLSFVTSIGKHVDSQSTIISVLAIPVLIPVVLILHKIGIQILMTSSTENSDYLVLLSITLLTIALSLILFPLIWKK